MKKAWEIINKSREFIKANTPKAKELQNLDYKKISSQKFIEALVRIDKILEAEYHLYIFFIDECFEIIDPELIKILPEVRMELSEFVDELHVSCDKVIAALAERFDMDWEIATYATFQEIIDLLRERLSLKEFKMIKNRPIAFLSLDNEFITLKGEEALEFKKYLAARKDDNSSKIEFPEIKGVIVFKGQIQGEVVILTEDQYYNHPEKVFKGKENFILVTPMTRPEIVPYLKKAAGIVTDEGGITCHAAIIAREMQIPCIVGTKIATRRFKDGDMVEVDAENGLIKKI